MKLKFLSLFLNFLSLLTFAQSARYVQIVDRSSQKPYDSIEVNFYHVEGGNFIFVANTLTDSNGMAKVPEAFGPAGKINGNNVSLTRKCIWPMVENVRDFDSGTRVFSIDKAMDCGHMKIQNVYFAYDNDRVIGFYRSMVDSVIAVLRENPNFKIKLQGHTDNRGTDEYNIMLSQKRADAVRDYMVSKGISKDRIIAKGIGSKRQLVPNDNNGQDDPEGRARNRRVEFKIVPEAPKDAPLIEYEEE
jgi:outer membrane protein OmpA-like peptidoglycan-associated protein